MDTTSPLFLALLANGPIKMDGYTYFLYGGNVNPSEALENPEQKGSDKRRIVSRKPVKCGKFTAGQSRIYRYGELKQGQEGSLKVIPYSTPSMAGAYNRVKEYGHSKRFGSPWDLWMLP